MAGSKTAGPTKQVGQPLPNGRGSDRESSQAAKIGAGETACPPQQHSLDDADQARAPARYIRVIPMRGARWLLLVAIAAIVVIVGRTYKAQKDILKHPQLPKPAALPPGGGSAGGQGGYRGG